MNPFKTKKRLVHTGPKSSLAEQPGHEEHLKLLAEIEAWRPGTVKALHEFALAGYHRAAEECLRTPSIAEEEMRHAGGDLHGLLRQREDLARDLEEVEARRKAVMKEAS